MADVENEEILDEKEADDSGLGYSLDVFTENAEVHSLIDKLKDVCDDVHAAEFVTQRFIFILDKYQEQPHLLDPYLDEILNTLIAIIRDKTNSENMTNIAFRYIKHIMKVRGFKVVVRHLPHEVSDLEPVLQLLESKSRDNCAHWESNYVLLLWMSIIVKIPFHMSRLDSCGDENNQGTVMERILNICKNYIHASSYFMIPSGFLTSQYVTRSDVKEKFLEEFLHWLYKDIEYKLFMSCDDEKNCLNSLIALASILKHGKREDLLPYASEMLQKILNSKHQEYSNTLVRKYGVKVIQRIGLIFLKPKVASWRYQRGTRSLADNLKFTPNDPTSKGDMKEVPEATIEEEDFDVPEEVEEVIEQLMQALKDSDTVIRWSAAKGIGRVTSRLPKQLGDEVVGSVLEFLNSVETDRAWHGGCLTLAELGRRGLLLPQRLAVVVPLILKALVFEESRGYYSIGDNVRDAACYVAWSFARAYEPQVLKPFINTIASGLLTVTLFDREVKCRRAGSAAFQENVGRQGTFPHGIEIVTTADYFSVGIRQNSFLKISVYVAQFEEYTVPLINHLLEKKVDHWDAAIRELTAKALHNLTPLAPDYVSTKVLSSLLEKAQSVILNCRHGAVLAIGEVAHALKLLNREISPEMLEKIKNLVYFYRENGYFGGVGGEILRQGFCSFIQNCALSQLPFHELPVIDELQRLIDECLLSEVSMVRSKAVSALPAFFEEYYQKTENGEKILLKDKCDEIVAKYTDELYCMHEVTRLGYAMAIGEIPRFMLMGNISSVVQGLLESLKINQFTLKWAESRRESIKALVSVVSTVGLEALHSETEGNEEFIPETNQAEKSVATSVSGKTMILPRLSIDFRALEAIFQNLLMGLGEYTQDFRGDIGAWVRETSMTGLEKMVVMTAKWNKQLPDESLLSSIIGGIVQQAVERIDRTRAHAGRVLSTLLYHSDPVIPNIPYREELLRIFPPDIFSNDTIWKMEEETFPRFVQLLSFPPYTHNVMEGLILSIGGLTERLVKHSSSSLFTFLKSIEDINEMSRICNSILDIFQAYSYNSRVIIPLFTFLDRLLGSGVIRQVLEDPNSKFAETLVNLTMSEVGKIKDFKKFANSMDVFCQLVQVKGPVSAKALSQMSIFLCNRMKAVRKAAASKLYECLLIYGDSGSIPEENLDEVMTLLSDTDWELEPQDVRPFRNKLCELMNIRVPKLVTKTA